MIKNRTLTTLISGVLMTASLCKTEAEAPNGSVAVPEGLTYNLKESILTRDTLTGDWGGLRPQLAEKGITLSATYQAEVFGNTGGARQGTVVGGLFNLALDIDLERLTGFLKDTVFHANVMYLHGPNLSGEYIGDFSGISNIAGFNSIRLQEIWVEKSFWDKRASVRVGMLAADTEFFTSDSSALFLNGTFGAFTLIGANFYDAPIYPVANPGIRFKVAPTSNFYIMAAAFGMDENSDPADNNDHGGHIHFSASDGVLFMAEAGYLVNQSPGDRGLTGVYKVGTFIQHGDYTTWESQANDALGTGPLSKHGTNYAVYGVVDQQIYASNGKIVTVFGRGGFAPSRYSFVSGYFDAGFNFTGFIPSRDQDIVGIAVANSSVSGEFSKADVLQGNPPSSHETVIEATYKTNLTPWCSIQPDLQYIINPSGVKGSDNAFVIGLRTTITF